MQRSKKNCRHNSFHPRIPLKAIQYNTFPLNDKFVNNKNSVYLILNK